MSAVHIVDYLRTPFGRFGGVLSAARPDDLVADLMRALFARHAGFDATAVDDVVLGCANQAGEDNRNIARMAVLLAGLPISVPGVTVNRLCGSGLDAIAIASARIKAGEADVIVAGGVESMSRAPFVLPKADSAFARRAEIYDTTLGWRFINPRLQAAYGTESMPETAENVAEQFNVARVDQDAFAVRSHQRAVAAQTSGRLLREIAAVRVPGRKGAVTLVDRDEHPRADTNNAALAKLPALFRQGGSVTAGNSSGVNDGAAVVLLASEAAVTRHGLTPLGRVLGAATVGLEPRIMGFGPAPAARKLMQRLHLSIGDFDVVELNEAFASQVLAASRDLGLPDDAAHLNPNGGAIALGHPLGASGARLAGTAALQLGDIKGRRALIGMCIGVGQGIAMAIESA